MRRRRRSRHIERIDDIEEGLLNLKISEKNKNKMKLITSNENDNYYYDDDLLLPSGVYYH